MSVYRQYAPEDLGHDGYPPVWHSLIKHEVREAAGNRCVRCGHPYRNGEHGNGEWSPCDERCQHTGTLRAFNPNGSVPVAIEPGLIPGQVMPQYPERGTRIEALWRILTVHHLDGDKANCRWWNLAALCQRCHLTIQGRVQMNRVWPWEHSDWFKPYAAGYYACAYLREDLTREQTMARLDELLALEHVA